MIVISPSRQKSWGWPAVVNLTLGGAGGGVYLLDLCFSFFVPEWSTKPRFIPFQLLSAMLVSIGFLAVSMEAGKPMRAYRLLGNLRGSWMSIESIAGALLIVFSVISLMSKIWLVTTIAAIAAFTLIVSQGWMVFHATSIPAWNNKFIPIVFIFSGLMTAAGLVLLNFPFGSIHPSRVSAILQLVVLINLISWLIYVFKYPAGGMDKMVPHLRKPPLLWPIVGVGHVLPFLLLFAVHGYAPNGVGIFGVGSFSGFLMILGGSMQKASIVFAAGYSRAISLIRSKH